MSDSPVVDFGAILAQFRQAAEAAGYSCQITSRLMAVCIDAP
jgi:hypothetical protein